MVNKDNKPKILLYLIAVLIIIFFVIIILSSSANIDASYSYEDEVSIKSGEYASNIKIGEVQLKNSGMLPSRFKFKTLKACTFDNDIYNSEIQIQYSDSQSNYLNGYQEQTYDISSKQEKNIPILVSYLPTTKRDGTISNETQILYLYEIENLQLNAYDFCNNAQKEDAFKTITINKE